MAEMSDRMVKHYCSKPAPDRGTMKGPMAKVRPNGAARWAQRTAAATEDYKAGVQNPRQSWQQATTAAAPAHAAAVVAANARGAFAQGVAKAGDAKWQRGATGKGADRFGPGAAAGQGDYESGVAPYLQIIESTQLPPRGPKGDPRNIDRVRVLAAALRKRKTGSVVTSLLVLCAATAVFAVVCLGRNSLKGSASQTHRDGTGNPIKAELQKASRPGGVGTLALFVMLAPCCLLGAALDLVSYSATAPGAGAPGLALPGDSLTTRAVDPSSKPLALQIWAKNQIAGVHQLTHASGHDAVRDLRFRISINTPLPLLPFGWAEPAESQELWSPTIIGSGTAGQFEIGHILFYYPDLPGVNAKLIDPGTLDARAVELVTVEDTTAAAVGATYGGARALNAGSDLLRANTDYAIVGAHLMATCSALTIRGTDFGNLRVGIPGMAGRPDLTAFWFPWISEQYGLPLIPVVNSANKAAIFIENVQDQAIATVPFSLMMVELSPG
jgi:hypothetical protein